MECAPTPCTSRLTAAALRRETDAEAGRLPREPATGRPGVAALRRLEVWVAEERLCGEAALERLWGAVAIRPSALRRLEDWAEAELRLEEEAEGREGVTLRLPEEERVAADPEGCEVE